MKTTLILIASIALFGFTSVAGTGQAAGPSCHIVTIGKKTIHPSVRPISTSRGTKVMVCSMDGKSMACCMNCKGMASMHGKKMACSMNGQSVASMHGKKMACSMNGQSMASMQVKKMACNMNGQSMASACAKCAGQAMQCPMHK